MFMNKSFSFLSLFTINSWISVVAAFLPAAGRQSRLPRSMPNLLQPTEAASFMLVSRIPDEPMEDRFDRWRLLQNILDLDIEEEQVEALVDVVVAGAASAPKISNQNSLTSQSYRNDVLSLERLYLPDPDDDKDAFDSLWDTVAEIHGRDAVKLDLRIEPRWPYVCCLVRILLQYDFLSRGIIKEAFDVNQEDILLDDEINT